MTEAQAHSQSANTSYVENVYPNIRQIWIVIYTMDVSNVLSVT
jgi:hypothetical protein